MQVCQHLHMIPDTTPGLEGVICKIIRLCASGRSDLRVGAEEVQGESGHLPLGSHERSG